MEELDDSPMDEVNLCPFYYELKPLLQDRPSMFANYTNESESEDNTDDENSIVTNGTDATNHTEISGLSTVNSNLLLSWYSRYEHEFDCQRFIEFHEEY